MKDKAIKDIDLLDKIINEEENNLNFENRKTKKQNHHGKSISYEESGFEELLKIAANVF